MAKFVNENPFVIANAIIKHINNHYNDVWKNKKQEKNDENFKYENSALANDLTQLKIQKLLYLTYGYYYSCTGKKLFNAKFEAWPYGPVIKNIYKKRDNKYDLKYIHNVFDNLSRKDKTLNWENKAEEDIFKRIINYFFMFSAWTLVDITHKFPWRKTFENKIYSIISDELIMTYFEIEKDNNNELIDRFKGM